MAPADIKYPTDVDLLNAVRQDPENIVDRMHKQRQGQGEKKPRTDRKIARKEDLKFVKSKNRSKKKRINAVEKQLIYVKRNIKHIDKLIKKGATVECLLKKEYRRLLVGSEICRQQQWMIENKREKIENRIVSVSQPHVRRIVRGKGRVNTEFGAKISVVVMDIRLWRESVGITIMKVARSKCK